jgi:hypothetical protein
MAAPNLPEIEIDDRREVVATKDAGAYCAGRLYQFGEPTDERVALPSYIWGVGAKKQRRLPSGRRQRQYAPSALDWTSV